MKIREILKNYQFYSELPKGKYSIYFSKFGTENYGFLARFTDISKIKEILTSSKLDKPYKFKSINMIFLYKNQKKQYAILKKELHDQFSKNQLKEEEKQIKDILSKDTEVESRKNLGIKITDIEKTDLAPQLKKLKKYVLERDMYFNVLLKEKDGYNLNLIYDRENLYFRIYPKLPKFSNLDLDYYKINNRIYFVAPVREKNNLENILSLRA